jgi:AraC family transcriptional regulator, arabinose operon regulatory protein
MLDNLNSILENSELNILEFNFHTRTELDYRNRDLPFYIMSYHKQGSAKLKIGDETYPLEPGSVMLMPPHVIHDHYKDSPEETVFLWWHFHFTIGNVIDVFKLFDLPYVFKLENPETFESIFVEYMDFATKESYLPTKILEKAKALELLYHLLVGAMAQRNTKAMEHHSGGFLDILAHLVNFPEEDISLGTLSKQLNMHPTYVSNRFKELFGKSPIQVQREMRMDKAKTLLKSSDLPVNQVAEATGFQTVPSFSRLFKSYVGVSPSQFRQLNRM